MHRSEKTRHSITRVQSVLKQICNDRGGQQWRNHIYSSKTLNFSDLSYTRNLGHLISNAAEMIAWRPVLPLIVFFILIIYEERVSTPSCEVIPGTDVEEYGEEDPEDLKAMMVANLLLLGSEAGYTNVYFRDYYLSKFFRRSLESLRPDMLLVLGDVSAKGYALTKSKWSSVLHQFQRILGPFLDLPFHVILGDRDVGECSRLNAKSVNWKANSFPGLDSSGCGAFEISNISFVSLNAVALLCGNNDIRFSVEKVIERESIDLQMETEGTREAIIESSKLKEASHNFGWRKNVMSSGSGPVLLLHFPLHRTANSDCRRAGALKGTSSSSILTTKTIVSRGFIETGPYELLDTLPPNTTEYIFQALRPRIVFSAHSDEFCIHTHSDGTHEVTVPAMSWDARDDPGFVVASFRRNGRVVTVSYCSLAKESHVVIAHITVLVLFILIVLVANLSVRTNLRR